jgi:WD40 repeat protein
MVLSLPGYVRLEEARRQLEQELGERCTLEYLGEQAQLSPVTVARIFGRSQGVDKQSLERLFNVFNLGVDTSDLLAQSGAGPREDWGEAIDVSTFFGRSEELQCLQEWILEKHCRLVTLLGMGGIGKSALSIQLATQLRPHFAVLIWRSLRSAPELECLLADILSVMADRPCPHPTIMEVIQQLRQQRVLLILDNIESLFQPGQTVGKYRKGYQDYEEFFHHLGALNHNSCVILTSREKPLELVGLEGEGLPIRTLPLEPLKVEDTIKLLEVKGLQGSVQEKAQLIHHYSGNPLALKLIATSITELFGGDIGLFLEHGCTLFQGVRSVLDSQFQRLTALEQSLMYWLAIHREPVSIDDIVRSIVPRLSASIILETLQSLLRRSLIEIQSDPKTRYTQQAVIMEYVTERLVDRWVQELSEESLHCWRHQAVVYAQSPDFVRQSQLKMLLQPLCERIQHSMGGAQLEATLIRLLEVEREQRRQGYVAGNSIQLARALQMDLKRLPLSGQYIRSVSFQSTNLSGVDLSSSELLHCLFAQKFGPVFTLCWHPQEHMIAAGGGEGEVFLWSLNDERAQLFDWKHQGEVWATAFSADGKWLATASSDWAIHLWQIPTGDLVREFHGHEGQIRSLRFQLDNPTLASVGVDQRVCLWDFRSGKMWQHSITHDGSPRALTFDATGTKLYSGKDDGSVIEWDLMSGERQEILPPQPASVLALQLSPAQDLLAVAYDNCLIYLWSLRTRSCLHILPGHHNWIMSLHFSPDGSLLASGSQDSSIGLWQVSTGQCLQWLRGHKDWVRAVRFSHDGSYLASASDDSTIRVWDVDTCICLRTLKGTTNIVRSIALKPDTHELVVGGDDQKLRLWSGTTCQQSLGNEKTLASVIAVCPHTGKVATNTLESAIQIWDVTQKACVTQLLGHQRMVSALTYNPHSPLLASASIDGYIRIWDTTNSRCLRVIQAHSCWVWSLLYLMDGKHLLSASDDTSIRLWQSETGICEQLFMGHEQAVTGLALHPEGKVLASTSLDRSVKIWDLQQGRCLSSMEGPRDRVWAVAFTQDGQEVVACGTGGDLWVWNWETGTLVQRWHAHEGTIYCLVPIPETQQLITGGADEIIKIWDKKQQVPLQQITMPRLYEGLNLRGVKGIAPPTQLSLQRLGAIL